MPNSTSNNFRPIATRGSDHVAAATSPDVHKVVGQKAKTKSFPNTVPSTRLQKGATVKTFIAGEPLWTQIGEVGPESDPAHDSAKPGTKSGTYRMEAMATSWSRDVIAEGNAVIRTYDLTTQNHANTVGIVLPDQKAADLADPTLPLKLPPECAYVTGARGGPGAIVSGVAKDWSRSRKPFTVGRAKPTEYQFPGDAQPRPANVYKVKVGGRPVEIVFPRTHTADDGRALATPHDIASGLAVLPPRALATINSVVMSPMPSPHDEAIKKIYKDPNFSSGASAGSTVTFYRTKAGQQDWIDGSMIHEAGHNVHDQLWTDPAARKSWIDAVTSDRNAPSGYAGHLVKTLKSYNDDFSETLVLYSMSKGTPCEAFARREYPARFRELDKIMQPPAPKGTTKLRGNYSYKP